MTANLDRLNAVTDLVQHDGSYYRLADLAYYMDDADRETIHSAYRPDDTAQAFWDCYASTFPDSVLIVLALTPSIA